MSVRDEGGGRRAEGPGRKRKSRSRSSSAASPARSEFDFINRLRRRTLNQTASIGGYDSSLIPHPSSLTDPSSLQCGIGDDAAVIRHTKGRDSVITADLLVEDIDFRLAWTTPRLLGRRALAVSLSDIAAMGARPQWALLCVGVPEALWESPFLKQFYEGFDELADEHSVTLIGGDVSRTPERFMVDSIVLGEVARGRALLRSGARAGDQIFVTGSLGGAAAGLRLLEEGARLRGSTTQRRSGRRATPAHAARPVEQPSAHALSRPLKPSEARQQLLLRQLRPAPRVAWGQLLGEKRLATAMIDLSDGLSSDLSHLCRESGVGARLDASLVPVNPALKRVAANSDEALALALHGGEDFELLFTVRPRHVAGLPAEVGGVAVTHIGEVTAERGKLRLLRDGRGTLLRPSGFQHFGRARGRR